MNKVKPIKPSEVTNSKAQTIPDIVFTVFNELIAKYWNGRSSRFGQDEVLSEITNRSKFTSRDIFDNNYLDVEDIYREQGWKVVYDKPAYCESYPATFTFMEEK